MLSYSWEFYPAISGFNKRHLGFSKRYPIESPLLILFVREWPRAFSKEAQAQNGMMVDLL